jgi:SPX domain protein involved in polyphosphate accumulation
VQRLSWSADEEDWRSVLIHIDQLRKRVSELESSQTQTQNRQTELVQATKVRIERMMGACQRMDELIKNFTAEISEKMNAMTLRLNERKLADHKIQELVDRHASMVQSYEIRLASLQKILSEQEMLLMNARSALQDVQRRR